MCKNLVSADVLLHERELDPNMQDINGWTALHRACKLGLLDTVKQLLALKRTKFSAITSMGLHCLHVAVIHNQPEVVSHLLVNKQKLGLDVDIREREHKCTAFILASKHSSMQSLQILQEFKANIYA